MRYCDTALIGHLSRHVHTICIWSPCMNFCVCAPPFPPHPKTAKKMQNIHSFIYSFIHLCIHLSSLTEEFDFFKYEMKYSTLKHELGISRFSYLTCGVSIQTSHVSASAAIQHLSFISAWWKIYVQLANPWLWNINSRWDAHESKSGREHIWVI